MYTREQTRAVGISGVKVGGGNPVRIQSMTNTRTQDAQATIQQILRLEQAGCEIVRVTVPDRTAAEALEQIKENIHIPLVADIHLITASRSRRLSTEPIRSGSIRAISEERIGYEPS